MHDGLRSRLPVAGAWSRLVHVREGVELRDATVSSGGVELDDSTGRGA